jgi:hypothetical protein
MRQTDFAGEGQQEFTWPNPTQDSQAEHLMTPKVMSPTLPRTKNDCASEGQYKWWLPISSDHGSEGISTVRNCHQGMTREHMEDWEVAVYVVECTH